jgi:hypothetical protein
LRKTTRSSTSIAIPRASREESSTPDPTSVETPVVPERTESAAPPSLDFDIDLIPRRPTSTPTFKFYDDEDVDEDAPTDVVPCPFEHERPPSISRAPGAAGRPFPKATPRRPELSFLPAFSDPPTAQQPESITAPVIAVIVLGALLVAGVSILLTLVFLRAGAESGSHAERGLVPASASLTPSLPSQATAVELQSHPIEPELVPTDVLPQDVPLEERDNIESEPQQDVVEPRRNNPNAALATILDSVTDDVRSCTELSSTFRPTQLAVHLVPGEEQRITVGAITPQPPRRIGRCIARIIHRATWPSPRARRPLVIHRFELQTPDELDGHPPLPNE